MIGSDATEVGFWKCRALNDAPREAKRELTKLIKGGVYRASFMAYDRTRGGVYIVRQKNFFA